MIKTVIQNMKQDICSMYFGASIILVFGVCLLSPGIGALDYNYISRPMIIEELLQHNKAEFSNIADLYNYESVFLIGIGGLFYTILPLLSMASIHRYCEERITGYWIQKTVKLGQQIGTFSNLISSAFVAILAVVMGLALFMLTIIIRLPCQEIDISVLLMPLCFTCLLAAVGAFLSVLIASFTKSKFYSFIIPLLLFYAENEFAMGIEKGAYSNFSIQGLMNPVNKIVSLCFILIMSSSLCMAVNKVEKGRWGIGA